jgi:hypothetical protein
MWKPAAAATGAPGFGAAACPPGRAFARVAAAIPTTTTPATTHEDPRRRFDEDTGALLLLSVARAKRRSADAGSWRPIHCEA